MPLANCAEAVQTQRTRTKRTAGILFFIDSCSSLFCLLEIRRDFMVNVIGQSEIAREIDFDPMAFPDGHRGHDVKKLVEDLRRTLRGALRESLTHEVATGCGEGTCGPALRDGSESANR